MPTPQGSDHGGDQITVGKIEGRGHAIAVGRGAKAINTTVGGSGAPDDQPPEKRRSWWRQLSLMRLGIGMALAIVAFVGSLWLYPTEWGESWRTVVALAVAAVVGVTLFLDAARNAYTR